MTKAKLTLDQMLKSLPKNTEEKIFDCLRHEPIWSGVFNFYIYVDHNKLVYEFEISPRSSTHPMWAQHENLQTAWQSLTEKCVNNGWRRKPTLEPVGSGMNLAVAQFEAIIQPLKRQLLQLDQDICICFKTDTSKKNKPAVIIGMGTCIKQEPVVSWKDLGYRLGNDFGYGKTLIEAAPKYKSNKAFQDKQKQEAEAQREVRLQEVKAYNSKVIALINTAKVGDILIEKNQNGVDRYCIVTERKVTENNEVLHAVHPSSRFFGWCLSPDIYVCKVDTNSYTYNSHSVLSKFNYQLISLPDWVRAGLLAMLKCSSKLLRYPLVSRGLYFYCSKRLFDHMLYFGFERYRGPTVRVSALFNYHGMVVEEEK